MSRPSDESMPQAVKDTVERTREPIIDVSRPQVVQIVERATEQIIDMSRTQVVEAIFEMSLSLLRPPPWACPDESRRRL